MRLKSIKLPLINGKTIVLSVNEYMSSHFDITIHSGKQKSISLKITKPCETHIKIEELEIKRFNGDIKLIANFIVECNFLRFLSTFLEKSWHH